MLPRSMHWLQKLPCQQLRSYKLLSQLPHRALKRKHQLAEPIQSPWLPPRR